MTEESENNSQPEESEELIEQRDREEVESKNLGIAGRIAATFIDSPISPLLMAPAICWCLMVRKASGFLTCL